MDSTSQPRYERLVGWVITQKRESTVATVSSGLSIVLGLSPLMMPNDWHLGVRILIFLIGLLLVCFLVHLTRAVDTQGRVLKTNLDELRLKADQESETVSELNSALIDLLDATLGIIGIHIGHGTFGPHQRATLYKPLDNEWLVPVARHSAQRDLDMNSRSRIPIGEGVVGKAWRDGQGEFKTSVNPATNYEGWVQENVRKTGLSEDVVRSLRMKSVHIVACTIKKDETGCAVLVYESTRQKVLRLDTLTTFVQQQASGHLAEIVTLVEPIEARLSKANEKGL